MNHTGNLRKMRTDLQQPVAYQLVLQPPASQQPGNSMDSVNLLDLNPLIGQPIRLQHTGAIHCVHCGRKTSKSFNQGYCFPCFSKLAECDRCIVKPELCHYAQGTCRDPAWGEAHCMQPHIVYLANSSGLKVGITRQTQMPTRWMDQGAVAALPILQVANRYLSGLMELAFKDYVADKTHWQQMLKGDIAAIDLVKYRDLLLPQVQNTIDDLRQRYGEQAVQVLDQAEVYEFVYPVSTYPTKVKALNLDKTPEVTGQLQGIKGQYLLLDSGVINLRKFAGYEVRVIFAAEV